MQATITPQPWTRKDVAGVCGNISVRTVERKFASLLRPAELRTSCREKTYDPTHARRILVRHRIIPRPV